MVSETSPYNEMRHLTVNMVRRELGKENETESPIVSALLEFAVMGDGESIIPNGGNAPRVQEQTISQIEGTGEMAGLYRVISRNAQNP